MSPCDLCQTCRECGAVAWCEGEPGQIQTPCPHFLPLCENCLDACPDCRKAMEREMYRTGKYDPLADPFVDTHAPKPVDHIAENGGYWWDGAWVPMPERKTS